MVQTGPPRLLCARKGAGGPVKLFSARSRSLGWPALFFSVALHGAVAAVAVLGIWGSQGSGGEDGMDLADEDTASAPVPVLRALPAPVPQKPEVKIHPVKPFTPVNLKRVLVENSSSDVILPKWDMQPTKPLEAATPPPPPPPTPEVRVAEVPPAKIAAQPSSVTNNGKGSKNQRRAAGKGSSNGLGSALLAAEAPRLVSSYPAPYPYAARKKGIEGMATVKVTVGGAGQVTNCSIWRSTGNADLDAAALKAVRGWKFTPAKNASADVLVKVSFRLS